MDKQVAKILRSLPPESRNKVLRMARALHQNRIERALQWREKLGNKEGSVLVDDAKHLP